MHALLDTNHFISYLLSANRRESGIGALLAAAVTGAFRLLFPVEVAEEIAGTVACRRDLAARTNQSDLEALIGRLGEVGERLPRRSDEVPNAGRDRKDDYLITQAVMANADYLVSWDMDLRGLGAVAGVRIVSPPVFLRVPRETGRLPR